MEKRHRTLRGALQWRLRKPQLRTKDATGERHASWMELFFDLVFVVGIAQLAIALEKDHSAIGFLWFAGLWLPVFTAWQGFSLYMDRFDTDDLYLRFSLFAGMMAVSALAMQVPHVPKGNGTIRFAMAYIVLRVLTIALYYRAYRHVPEVRPLIRRYNTGYLISVALWTISLFVPLTLRYVLWGAGVIVDLLIPPISGRHIRAAPISATHVSERFGLFTLIVLGESLVAVAVGTVADEWHFQTALAAVLGFISVICLWWVYFDTNANLELKAGNTGVLFAYMHLILLGALAAVGAGTHILLKEAPNRYASGGLRGAMCGGAAFYLLSLIVAQSQTVRDVDALVTRARFVTIIAQIVIGLVSGSFPPLTFAVLQCVSLIPLVLIETYRNTPIHAEGRQQEEAATPNGKKPRSDTGVAVGE